MIMRTTVKNHPMSSKAITTQDAPVPVGPYNQAVLAGSGSTALARSLSIRPQVKWWGTVMWQQKPSKC